MPTFRLFYYVHIELKNSTEICYQKPEHLGDFATLELAQGRAVGHFKERSQFAMPDGWSHYDNLWRLLVRYVTPVAIANTAYEITEW